MGVLATIMTELAGRAQETRIVMIDATRAQALRTASSLAGQNGGPSQTGDGMPTGFTTR